MLFEIQVHDVDGWRVVAPVGELDLADAATLRARVLHELSEGHRRVVIDLVGVDFMDSVGVGMLVAIRKRAASVGAELALARPEPQVRRVIELAGVDGIFEIRHHPGPAGEPHADDVVDATRGPEAGTTGAARGGGPR